MKYFECVNLVLQLESLLGFEADNYRFTIVENGESDSTKAMLYSKRLCFNYKVSEEIQKHPIEYLIEHNGYLYIPALVRNVRCAFVAKFSELELEAYCTSHVLSSLRKEKGSHQPTRTNHKSNNKQTNDKKKKPKNTETVGFHLPNNS